MDLRIENGVYVLDVIFLNGESAEKGKILIDSGAADNVMPANELKEVPMGERDRNVNFTTASGKPMQNYGRKDVEFVPAAFWETQYGYPFRGAVRVNPSIKGHEDLRPLGKTINHQ